MTAYSALAPELRLLLSGVLFLASAGELALCLYRYLCTGKVRYCIKEGLLFVSLLLLLSFAVGARSPDGAPACPIRLPWLAFPLLSLVVFLQIGVGFVRERRRSRNRLSPNAVKEALDNLDSGILFADADGRVVLSNLAMNRAAFALTGRPPQTMDDIASALAAPPKSSGVVRPEGLPELFRFPDGSVLRFRTVSLHAPALSGFTQTTAQDMTELYNISARLEDENEKLRSSNEELQRLQRHIGERIREKETLDLKIRIHNDIGACLIAISELLDGGTEESVQKQLKKLCEAVGCLGGPPEVMRRSFADAYRQAADMNVALRFDGCLPQGETAQELIVLAAKECITNCVRHARGSAVTVTIGEDGGILTVIVTNDGAPPAGPVEEGGGLSALRKSVEDAGGAMSLSHSPVFALKLRIPDKEEKYHDPYSDRGR